MAVTTGIEEGPQYKLGEVAFVGDSLPLDAIQKVAKFKKGQIADWSEIEKAMWEAEKPVKRTGYLPLPLFPNGSYTMTVSRSICAIAFRMGPLFHSGQLKIIGLTPEQEAKSAQGLETPARRSLRLRIPQRVSWRFRALCGSRPIQEGQRRHRTAARLCDGLQRCSSSPSSV
ncbi:MAG: hypothetical protein WDO73_04310 [Ignavibacteriota bacterium]